MKHILRVGAFVLAASIGWADDLTYDSGTLSFETTNQRIDGPGDALDIGFFSGGYSVSHTFAGSDGFDEVATVLGAHFGASGGASVSLTTGISATVSTLDTGSVDIAYPVRVLIDYPEPNSFAQGNVIAISTDVIPSGTPAWDAVTAGMSAHIGSKFGYSASLNNLSLCFFACTDEGNIPLGNIPVSTITLFSMNSDTNIVDGFPQSNLLPNGGVFGIPYEFGFVENQILALSGIVGIPQHHITSFSTAPNGQLPALTASAQSGTTRLSNPFVVDLMWDALSLTGAPLSFDLSVGELEVEWNLGTVGPLLNIRQSLGIEFAPSVDIELVFATPVKWLAGAPGDPIPPASALNPPATHIALNAGDTLFIQYPDGKTTPTNVSPKHRMRGDFSNLTTNRYSGAIAASFGSATLGLPSVEIIPGVNSPQISIDVPAGDASLIDETWEFAAFTETVVDDSWPMGGFSSISTDPLSLDPENPRIGVVKEASRVRNNGAGSRSITYTFKITNDGDVPLHHVQLADDLAAAFTTADWFRVDALSACGVLVNPAYDGDIDTNLLWDEPNVTDGGNVLDVGEEALVQLSVTVAPGPSPFGPMQPYPFTNVSTVNARSKTNLPYIPSGTPVSAAASATVNLGPAQITRLQDFAVYASELVQFHESGDSFGHVGSALDAQVTEGYSGVIAGDFHIGQQFSVHGSILADYVYVSGALLVNGVLQTTGAAISPTAVPTYGIPSKFVSSTNAKQKLAGDVALAPGTYGSVTLATASTLRLGPGAYSFRDLQFQDGSTIVFDPETGPIDIRIEHRLVVGRNVSMSVTPYPSSTNDINIYVHKNGGVRVGEYSTIVGTLTAPRSVVTFYEGSYLQGAVHAYHVVFRRGASFAYHDDEPGLLFLEFDGNVNGTPDCLE